MKYFIDVIPACPESFFVPKKDSRRASLAGMTVNLIPSALQNFSL
jgi:hypothetical protein